MNDRYCRSYRVLAVLTALSGASIIMLGAWGAHRLTDILNSAQLHTYDTALRYQTWHTLALLAVLVNVNTRRWQRLRGVCVLWGMGMVLFSGSLYAIALVGWPMGLITPCGGLLLMAGWLWLARQWWCITNG